MKMNFTMTTQKTALVKKILTKVRYGLTLQSIRNQLSRIGIEFSPYYLFQEGMNISEVPQIKGVLSDYSCELLKAEDMKEIGAINFSGYSEAKLLPLLDNGELCIGLKKNDEIAAFMWINFKEIKFKTNIIYLNNNEAYLWFMYTLESYRGENLAPYLRYKSYEILKDRGLEKFFSISEYFNTPAIKFKMKLNAKKLKLILFIQLFNKFRWNFVLRSYSSN